MKEHARDHVERLQSELRLLLESAPDAIVSIDQSGTVLLVNAQTELLFGYARAEMLGQKVEMLLPERFRKGHLGHRSSYAADLRTRRMGAGLELAGRRKDGSEFPVDISLSTIDTPEGPISSACIRDMTAQKHAEDIRRNSDERFAMLVESAPDAVTIIDAAGQIVLVNKQTEALFGYERGELIGKQIEVLLPQRFRERHPQHRDVYFADAHTRPMGANLDLAGLRKDGSEFPVDISLSAIDTDEGRFATAFIRDVTARKTAEVVGRELNRELTTANALLETRAMELARSNTELEQFASITSHDLQEPLRKIRMFGDRLRTRFDDNMPAEVASDLGRIESSAERMQTLITDLLTFARVASRGDEFEPVDLAVIAREVLGDLEARVTELNAEVELGELPTIDADPTQMRQLLQNLLGNALKFHREGVTPVVRIRAEIVDGHVPRFAGQASAGDRCVITVEDNGIGFDAKYAERIFTAFERLHGRSVYEGTGIGLSIARKIAWRHGGDITAHGDPDHGATLTVTLPCRRAKPTTKAKERAGNDGRA